MRRIFKIIKSIATTEFLEETVPFAKDEYIPKTLRVVSKDICNHCQELIPLNKMVCESSICVFRAKSRNEKIKIDMPIPNEIYQHPSRVKSVVNR